MIASAKIDFSPLAEVRDHLRFVFGGTRGYVCLALNDRSEPKPIPEQTFYHWPSQVDDLMAAIRAARQRENIDLFYSPYPMQTQHRRKHNSAARRVVHADADKGLSDDLRSTLRRWGFRLVSSGTPGNYHVYGRLSRSLTHEEHRGIEEALRRLVDGDDKIADNDFLRIPNTTNWKNGNKVRVESYGKERIDADKLMSWLGATPAAVREHQRSEVQAVPVPDDLPEDIAALREEESRGEGSGRYKRAYNAVLAVAEAGYTRDQVHAILADYAPGVDKFGSRWHDQIDDILDKSGKELVKYDPDECFWSARPVLSHIKQYAEAGEANPWATLGVVMVRVLHKVPPRVMLPGRNGTDAGTRALNMYVALIGPSGAGKKTATDAAALAVDVGETYPYLPIGSGEGIAKAYRRPVIRGDEGKQGVVIEGGVVVKSNRIIFDVAEVSTWNALTGRTGNTLATEVLKGFSGEALGFTNSDEMKSVTVPANSYRMGLVIGAQPGACGPLLGNAEAGLPQRFLWMPAMEDQEYDFDNMPEAPPQRVWEAPHFPASGHTIRFPESVMRRLFYERRKMREDPMESQAIVIKMRVAVALALLDGRLDVTDEDWDLASTVMVVSRRTRSDVMAHLKEQRRREAHTRGKLAAEAKHAETRTLEQLDMRGVRSVADRIMALLDKTAEKWMLRNPLRTKLKADRRKYFDAALDLLVEEKKVTVRQVKGQGTGTQRVSVRG
ncbi:RepB family DNA primase [Micromonospora sp. 4G55]|uniref:RepB family DNA primase n=1 Tax=Micromonospora sp. 4G55 TaxID=2806102 RepID=UPI001A3D69D7|nr:RepB family DNA primase [Micromonospora sp. 4G55]MBM0258959.1 hypothetical protein [Micromonospora sp. 4G55]